MRKIKSFITGRQHIPGINRKFLPLILAFAFIFTATLFSTAAAGQEPLSVKVGVYNNEPLLFADAAGKGKGVFVDIVEHVASKEGWRIEYVTGTWDQCLSRLENNQIDILGTIGFTKARDKLYDFGRENLLTNWGQLYTPAGSDIKAITDVAGKKVSVLKGDIHYAAFAQIIDSFGIKCEFIETDNYRSVLDLVSRNQADAGVVNRFFGMKFGGRYKLDKSGVIFNPIKLYYAVPEGKNSEIIDTIDRYIVL
ncbi:MAG: transporter substrate-binding domain-containing protein, partial [Deltaproteobacteria bacterium]|nr:transporter substrate-binding domain-containing protein [Deltaproteobacteria bacterium]